MIRILDARIGEGAEAHAIVIDVEVEAPLVFDPDVEVRHVIDGVVGGTTWQLRSAHDLPWLPRGVFRFRCVPAGELGGSHGLRGGERVAAVSSRVALATVEHDRCPVAAAPGPGPAGVSALPAQQWDFRGLDESAQAFLSVRRGHDDWFFRHFDHAARTVISYMLGDSPLLRGKILDLGCGDGITDFGMALRCQPEVLVGLDPFRGFDRLPAILSEVGFPVTEMPECLSFVEGDGNHLPFPDDSFDVVVSWGSVEHIAGGYLQTLREIKRVLRPDGLLFIHPGLFYSNIGHHLGEFSDEPFFHLKRSHEELRDFVLGTQPKYIDRSGHFATPEEYWQWYCELNPITVDRFEDELRALEFEPWRVAIRTADRVEYTPELQRHRMQDLATNELYVSCYNRKKPRPPGFKMREPGAE